MTFCVAYACAYVSIESDPHSMTLWISINLNNWSRLLATPSNIFNQIPHTAHSECGFSFRIETSINNRYMHWFCAVALLNNNNFNATNYSSVIIIHRSLNGKTADETSFHLYNTHLFNGYWQSNATVQRNMKRKWIKMNYLCDIGVWGDATCSPPDILFSRDLSTNIEWKN